MGEGVGRKNNHSIVSQVVAQLLVGSSALICSAHLLAAESTSASESDTPDAGSGAKLEEIVVSARRVREEAQSVPISITAVTQASLDRQDIRTATDLQMNVPGLTICCGSGQADYNFLCGIQGVQSYFAETPLLAFNGISSLSGNAMYFDLDSLRACRLRW